ncbi:MAG TPA: sugar phosphate isomerase/epimerase [Armatimonadetes bacterium]|nr:sugar phosphate isomerase/epimerase [Armatimonadota bacterium]
MPQPEVILTGFADEGPVSKRAEEQLTLCRGLGLAYYSLRFVDVGNGVKNVMQLTRSEIKRLQELHDEFEMRVSSIGSPLGKIKLRNVEDGTANIYVPFKQYLKEEVTKAIELARAFDTKLIRGFSFYPPKNEDPWLYVDEAAERLQTIAELCAEGEVCFGLEVEANLVGRNGDLQWALYQKVNHDHLYLVFDGANLVCQGYTPEETFQQYRRMRRGIGWLHIKDYRLDPKVKWRGYVDEEMLRHFVPVDRGDVGHERILRDFRSHLPRLARKLRKQGIPGVFLDLEPHLKGGGQFGGFSGPDGFGVALRALCRLLDYVGINYHLTEHGEWR